MSRFTIHFQEKESVQGWSTISTEDYPEKSEAMDRFKKAVEVSFHSVNSLSIVVIDNYRKQYNIDDEIIATFEIINE